MLITDQFVIIKWNNKYKKYYTEKGYIYTKNGDTFLVNINDLKKGSGAKVRYNCDYCNNEILIPYKKINFNQKYCCNNCKSKKFKETCIKKYGVDNVSKHQIVKNKIKETNLKKYGYENPMKNKEILNKLKQTNLKKYGYEYSFQSNIVKEKSKKTCLKKYGVQYYSQSLEFKEKIKKTSLQKYGVEHPFQSIKVKQKIKESYIKHYGVDHNMKSKDGYDNYKKSIIKKYGVDNIAKCELVKQNIRNSLYKNNTAPCSKQQKYLCDLLNGKLNYPVNYFSLDIAFPNKMVYIEYDGSGHDLRLQRGYITEKEFKKQEINRKLYLQKIGWKLIRIISKKDILYSDAIMLDLINRANEYLLNTFHSWVEIDIDNNIYKCSQFICKINCKK